MFLLLGNITGQGHGCQGLDFHFGYHLVLLGSLQICAVLAAVTEVIRAQGGVESETEYFGALVSTKGNRAGCCYLEYQCIS